MIYLKRLRITVSLFERLIKFYTENRIYQNYFSPKPIIIYIGAANSRNLGDVLLYKAIQNAFKENLLVPNFPKSNINNRIVINLLDTFGSILFRGFRSPSAAMLGGGTLMNCPFFFKLLKHEYKSDLPLIIFGAGMQDIEYWGDHLDDELVLYRKARFVTVRNPYDAQVLSERGIKSTVIGDPVLYLCKPHQKKERRNRIGINVGCDRFKTYLDQDEVNQVVAALAQCLIERGFEVEFFAMHDHDAEDIELIRCMDGLQESRVWDQYKDWQAFLDKIHDYDLVIGQRLHAVITACGSGVPAISMSYRPKCLHFMESVDMEKYCLRIDQFEVDQILDLVDEIISNYDEISTKLLEKTDQYRRLIKKNAQEIFQVLYK